MNATVKVIERLPGHWMSQAEACRFFGLSPEYLLVLEGEGYLSPIRDGGHVVRYWPADVLAAIESRGNGRHGGRNGRPADERKRE